MSESQFDGTDSVIDHLRAKNAKQSALLAQMAAALEFSRTKLPGLILQVRDAPLGDSLGRANENLANGWQVITNALTAYATMSPDPQWQRVPEECVVVPEKLTEEMLYAGLRYLNSLRDCPYPGMQPSVPNFWASIIERARGEG